ncbi:hypothetical protein B7R54_12410 [Subtercola boreus]|uniref:HTH cro/C1-type domain-containing protein n=1 Tax=Subtercola boreus TaxID=120213 RepID=A0A3E0VIZ2_9MICO|nr:XRE family transcriptional regulator [Subtercola boreus]RFA09916.1 hypothetical protein B7R54_12410 [Subtercola boreus]TQL52948.1 transcriptional regulator with XRE-family HTH domain [Subtercola boreus]
MSIVNDHELRLGRIIHDRRKDRGLRLVQVAEATGLSHSFLSQLERGKTRASMRSLFAIANALDTTQEELLAASSLPGDDDSHGAPSAQLAAESPQRRGAEPSARLLMHAGSAIDVTEFIDLPTEHGAFFQHPRPELIYVVRGQVEFQMRQQENSPVTSMMLQERNSVLCPGNFLHRYRSVGTAQTVALMIHYDG